MKKTLLIMFLIAVIAFPGYVFAAEKSCCLKSQCGCGQELCCKDGVCQCPGQCCKDGDCNCGTCGKGRAYKKCSCGNK